MKCSATELRRLLQAGLEPATSRLEGGYTIQLCYWSFVQKRIQSFFEQNGNLSPFLTLLDQKGAFRFLAF